MATSVDLGGLGPSHKLVGRAKAHRPIRLLKLALAGGEPRRQHGEPFAPKGIEAAK